VGADAFASDLNPVPVLLNKVVLEYIPKYGQRLADEVRKWGEWIKREAEKELAEFYPKDADGATPIAYLWARTIQCEGPGCGAEVPLIRSLWLERDLRTVSQAGIELQARKAMHTGPLSLVPEEKLDVRGVRHTWSMIYGFESWDSCYTNRQLLALVTLQRLLSSISISATQSDDQGLADAVKVCLALAVSRQTDYTSSLCSWHLTRELIGHTFARQALPMVWDFAEVNPFSGSAGDFEGAVDWIFRVCQANIIIPNLGTVQKASATEHPLPSGAADLLVTDPPYYDAVPYAYLSDYFYVWIRRSLYNLDESLFSADAVPKDAEIVVDRPHELSNSTHNIAFYERELMKAFAEGRRILRPEGLGTIVFASKTTASWEAILKAVVDAGWIITGSWPIDTEMETRVSAQGQARLASSVHLVCRPRGNPDGSVRADAIGDWRDVVQELPRRIHEWMPRLAEEGVVGADAIFACLGPALEVFSRYQRVEKASGEQVTLADYLESVWAAVANEALATVLGTTDAQGFEADARLTVIWLWVAVAGKSESPPTDEDESDSSEDEMSLIVDAPKTTNSGIVMEYDAARKLAQGMGVHLEELSGPGGILTVSGKQASLNRVSLRESFLFSSQQSLFDSDEHMSLKQPRMPIDPKATLRSVSGREADLFDRPSSRNPEDPNQLPLPTLNPKLERKPLLERLAGSGSTTLDRLHQAMLLFSRGQVSLLSLFLEFTGAGQDQRFWRLAQALSALYPSQTEEKRWVDGVLARKKGLGF
jgi:putative DNA methylase